MKKKIYKFVYLVEAESEGEAETKFADLDLYIIFQFKIIHNIFSQTYSISSFLSNG